MGRARLRVHWAALSGEASSVRVTNLVVFLVAQGKNVFVHIGPLAELGDEQSWFAGLDRP